MKTTFPSRMRQTVMAMGGMMLLATVGRAQAPNIASWNPWHAPVGATIDVSGANLDTTVAFYFNNVPCTSINIHSQSWITVVVPVGATTGKLKVTNANGSYTTGTDFPVDGTGGGGGGGGSEGDSGAVVTPPNIAIPAGAMTGHPRIFVRQQDIPMLRNWATASNPIWTSLVALANNAKQRMDNGQIVDAKKGNGNMPAPTESYAEIFAFMSLVHPDANVREDFANRAYTLIMPIFTEAAKGMDDNQPYRDHVFATDNRASWYGEGFPLTVDWIYQKFTAADKAKIRTAFLRWCQENSHASTTAQEHPKPLNTYNDPTLVDTIQKVRWATNNYYCNHAREVGLMSMALDELDDVPATASDPAAGTLRKFVGNAMQAWLYQIRKFEDTDGAGGISPEGLGYGELSERAKAFLLLALHTTGVDNAAVYGPVADTIKTPYWAHEVEDSYLHLMSPSQVIQESWVGPVYLPYLFSDTAMYKNVDYVRVFGALAIYARNTGDMAHYAKLRWMIDNLPPGGLYNRDSRIYSALDGSSVSLGIFYYLACDPAMTSTPDPRALMPTEYKAPGLGILSSRTDWSANASWFVSKATWNTIDHQFGDGNSIAFWRGGEWLTKPRLGYGSKVACSDYQNTLAIQNPAVTNISFWMDNEQRGSQWIYDPASDPVVMTSSGVGFAFTQGDITGLYNNPQIGANDVAHASRSTFFLKPDTIVTYDRAKSTTANRFKRYWLNTPVKLKVTGNVAKGVTAGGQKLSIDTLLPVNAVLTTAKGETLGGEPAVYEPMGFRFLAEDPSNPTEIRFLNVVQGKSSNEVRSVPVLVQSTSGTPYEGAVVAHCATMFKKNLYDTFAGVTFIVPPGTSKFFVSGLAPNTKYKITKVKDVNTNQSTITIVAGGSKLSDAAGVLQF